MLYYISRPKLNKMIAGNEHSSFKNITGTIMSNIFYFISVRITIETFFW